MLSSILSGTIATMEGLLLRAKASFRSLGESFGYASSNDSSGDTCAKRISRGEFDASTRSATITSDAEPSSSAREIPGAFPDESDKRITDQSTDPASIPLPESVQDDGRFPLADSAANTPTGRKRKRAPTDLPSQKPVLKKDHSQSTLESTRSRGRQLWYRFTGRKQFKGHDESDKENDTSPNSQRPSSRHINREHESKVTSVLRDLRKGRKVPKHLQSARDVKVRPTLTARPVKRLRHIPPRIREGEDSEDELAHAVARPQSDDELAQAWTGTRSLNAPPATEAMFRSLRVKETGQDGAVDVRRLDLDSIFDKPDIGLRPSLSISNFMQREIEEGKRIAEEERRQKEEAERRAAEEKKRKEIEARLAKTGGLRIPKQRFVVPVGDDWRQRAYDTLSAPPNASLAATAEGTELRRHDFAKVVPATVWLNDEIVNGVLLWLDRAINSAAGIKDPKKQTRKCLALSSFFWKRLVELNGKNTQRTLRRFGVEQRNLLDVDTILLPICESNHWTLVVVRPTKRTIAYMDSMRPDRPVTDNKRYTNLTLNWLRDVLGPKFEEDRWKVIRHDAPQQNNGYDCGVFTITNAMCVALGLSPIDSYREEDMPDQRIRLACTLLNNGFSGDFDLRVY